jgi:hypothetical protein
MNIRLRSRNKGPVNGPENPFVPTAEESSPRSKQAKRVAHRFSYIKTVLCVMSLLQRVKQEIRNIIDYLRQLRNAVRRKRPEEWSSVDRPIHNDAPAHSDRATFLSHRRNRPSAATSIFSGPHIL